VNLDPAQVTSALKIEPDQIQSLAEGLAGGFFGWVGSLLAVVLDLVTVVVFSFYIAGAGPRLVQHVAVWLPPGRQPVLGEIWDIAEQKDRRVRRLEDRAGGGVGVLPRHSVLGHRTARLAAVGPAGRHHRPVHPDHRDLHRGGRPVVVALADKPINAIWIVLFAIVYQQIETYVFTPKVSHRTMESTRPSRWRGLRRRRHLGSDRRDHRVPIVAVVVSVVQTYGRRYELVPALASDRKRTLKRTRIAAERPSTLTGLTITAVTVAAETMMTA